MAATADDLCSRRKKRKTASPEARLEAKIDRLIEQQAEAHQRLVEMCQKHHDEKMAQLREFVKCAKKSKRSKRSRKESSSESSDNE